MKLSEPQHDVFAVVPLSQRDRRWAGAQLGFSDVKIGDYGCAISSLAMLVNAVRGDNVLDPLRVDAALKASGCYGGPWRNYVVWSQVHRAFPELKYAGRAYCREEPATRKEFDMIDHRLAIGMPVIIEVDISRAAGYQQHFVLVAARDSLDYTILDPWEWQESPFWEHKPAPLCPRYGSRPEFALCGVIGFDRE